MLLVLFRKILGKHQSHAFAQEKQESLEQQVIQIQQGDLRLRNEILTNYQPYIAKITSRFCKRYIDPTHDDEFSVAITAFNEALNKFSPDLGRSFLGFAETVIRRRLIDYVRKEQRFTKQIPLSSFEIEDAEDAVVNPVEIHQAIEQYEKSKTIEDRRLEIMELNNRLADLGISFTDLVGASPKHADSRKMLFEIGKTLADDGELMNIVIQKNRLPIKELLDKASVQVSRKTLERNRKYLIVLAIIHNGPFPYLKEYLHTSVAPPEGSDEVE